MANLPFFVAGVRGGHLARRIEDIVANRRGSDLTRARRAALVFGALTFGLAPMVVGALTIQSGAPSSVTLAAQTTLPSFEVASVKRNPSAWADP